MTPATQSSRPFSFPAHFTLLSLLVLLGLFPPETRSEAMVGCAALVALLVVVSRHASPWRGGGPALIVLTLALALPAAWAAYVPGAVVRPLALALTAAGAGLSAAALGERDRTGRSAAMALAAAAGVASLHGVWQKLWGLERLALRAAREPHLPDHQAVLARLESGRAFAGFMTPAAFGGYLALALPVTVGLAVGSSGRKRHGWVALALLEVAGILTAASATAAAALLVAVALGALLWSRESRRLGAGVALLVLVLAGVALQRGGIALRPGDPEGPWRLRAGNFRSAWAMAADHPWIGVGPGGFAESYPAYRQPGDNEIRHAHNLPLELAADLGPTAALLVTALFFWIFLKPLWRERAPGPAWRKGLAVGLAAFALHNLGDFTVFMPSLFWTAALLRGTLARGAPRGGDDSGSARVLAGASLAGVLAAAVITLLAGLSTASRLAAREAAYAGEIERSVTHAERAVRLAPWSVDAALILAGTTGELAAARPALRATALERAERAVRLSPVRPSGRELRARARILVGDLEGAYADMRRAARLYPVHPDYARESERLRERIEQLTAPEGGAR